MDFTYLIGFGYMFQTACGYGLSGSFAVRYTPFFYLDSSDGLPEG
ncbi:hypothetical protein [Neisseria chenwenguii]|nr:hypothetical protein [Neisseria chenwenguii]